MSKVVIVHMDAVESLWRGEVLIPRGPVAVEEVVVLVSLNCQFGIHLLTGAPLIELLLARQEPEEGPQNSTSFPSKFPPRTDF